MARKTTDLEAGTVTFEFGEGVEDVVFDYDKCSDAMKRQLGLHGASQKGGDSYASAKGACEGTEINPTEWSRAQAQGTVDQIYNDEWSIRVAGAGAVTDLAQALSEAVDCTIEEAVERLADAEGDEKKALRKHPDVAAVLARIKSERAQTKAAIAEAKAGSGPDLSEFMAQ